MSPAALRHACPSEEELACFCRGQLAPYRLDQIADHLEGCGDCQSSLERVSKGADDLLTELSHLPALDLPQDATFEGEMAALETKSLTFCSEPLEEPLGPGAGPASTLRIGEYQIEEAIGRGGMGTVYRAVHTRLDKQVAIKVLSPHRLGDAAAVARFEREMRAVGKLSHPNIVTATDAGEIDGAPFLVMEYVEGTDLARLIRQQGRLPVADACEIARQTAIGLQYAHSYGLVHRDIKPSNLLLTFAPTDAAGALVKVADLGLALLHEPDPGADSMSSTNLVIGSLDYMAPEQADNAHQVDQRADLYSLGCTLYELLTGRPPFALPGQTRLQKLKAHGDASAPPLADSVSNLPAGLEPLVRKLLAKNPGDRFSNASELAAAIAPFAVGADLPRLLGKEINRESAPHARAAKTPTRKRSMGMVLGFLGPLAAAAVIYVQTDRGTLEIESDDDEVTVRVEQDGKLITLLDLKTKKEVKLRSGTYAVALGEADDDLALDANEFTLRRGDKEVLHVRRQPPDLLQSPFDAANAKRHQERWARFRDAPQTTVSETGLSLTLIPPGAFEMRPGYRVKITKPYYLGTYEVTVAQFRQFAEATGYKSALEEQGRGVLDLDTLREAPGMNWRNPALAHSEEHPVAGVTWFDAEKFCAWLSEREKKKYHLPTEAQWEWGARSGTTSVFAWGDDVDAGGDYEWYKGNSDGQSHAVGGKQPNAWGLFDTNGNLVEWCQDWAKDPYPQGEVSDPMGPAGPGTRTLRGGSYFDAPMPYAARGAFGPDSSMVHCGFRVCREF